MNEAEDFIGPHFNWRGTNAEGKWILERDGREYHAEPRVYGESLADWYKRAALQHVVPWQNPDEAPGHRRPESVEDQHQHLRRTGQSFHTGQNGYCESAQPTRYEAWARQVIKTCEQCFEWHGELRTQWCEYFATPNRRDAALFCVEELSEVANALTLNSGQYNRNGDGAHKATGHQVMDELAELFLMVHAVHGVVAEVDTGHLFKALLERESKDNGIEDLAIVVTGMVQVAMLDPMDDQNTQAVRFNAVEAMAVILSFPHFRLQETEGILRKWEKRAMRKNLLALAEVLGVEIVESE